MSSGNGIDIAAVYQLLTEVAGMVGAQGRKLDSLEHRIGNLEQRIGDLDRRIDDPVNGLAALRRSVDDQAAGLASLRRAVTDYHSAVLGHGILISELDEKVRAVADLDERVRRIERHLNLSPAA